MTRRIERPDGLLVERLLDAGLRVLALHPNQVASVRHNDRSPLVRLKVELVANGWATTPVSTRGPRAVSCLGRQVRPV